MPLDFADGGVEMRGVTAELYGLESKTPRTFEEGPAEPPLGEREEGRPMRFGQAGGQPEHLSLGSPEEGRGCQMDHDHGGESPLFGDPGLRGGNDRRT